jgi:adenylate cyclase class 2
MHSTVDYREIEVKFHLPRPQEMRQRILALGGRSQGRIFETNLRYDKPDESLLAGKCLLRLRRDKGVRLTYKCEPDTADKDFKSYKELEVTVSDFDVMDRILVALGFCRVQVYEKWRETISLGPLCLCLDSMPVGEFLEIEGPKEDIRHMARNLDLAWEKRILANYLAIFAVIQQQAALPFVDMTFANFKTTPVPFTRFVHLFEAGGPR